LAQAILVGKSFFSLLLFFQTRGLDSVIFPTMSNSYLLIFLCATAAAAHELDPSGADVQALVQSSMSASDPLADEATNVPPEAVQMIIDDAIDAAWQEPTGNNTIPLAGKGPCGFGIFGGLDGKSNSLAYDRFVTKCENPSFGYGVAFCKEVATKAFEGRNLTAPFPVGEDELSDFCSVVRNLLLAHENHLSLRASTQPFTVTSLLTSRSQSNSTSRSSNSEVDGTMNGKGPGTDWSKIKVGGGGGGFPTGSVGMR